MTDQCDMTENFLKGCNLTEKLSQAMLKLVTKRKSAVQSLHDCLHQGSRPGLSPDVLAELQVCHDCQVHGLSYGS